MSGACTDVTSQSEAEKATREGHEQLQLAMDAGGLGDWAWVADDDRVTLSSRAARIVGLDACARLTSGDIWQWLHEEDRASAPTTIQAALEAHTACDIECRVVHAPSGERWIAARGRGVYADDGSVCGMTGVVQDITERRRSEKAARVGEQHLRAALDALNLHHQCLQTLSAKLLEAQERERGTVAHELHEEVCQALAAIKIHLQSLRAGSSAEVDKCVEIADSVLQRVRNLSSGLRPQELNVLGLNAAVESMIARRSGPQAAQVEFRADASGVRLHADLETTCFRVIQEALANADRHANAKRIWIMLVKRNDRLQLTICDDGQGFDVRAARQDAADAGTSGLTAMRERVRLARGHLEIASSPALGTEIDITLPFASAPALA
jgi:PAS domain S-box-containing protein